MPGMQGQPEDAGGIDQPGITHRTGNVCGDVSSLPSRRWIGDPSDCTAIIPYYERPASVIPQEVLTIRQDAELGDGFPAFGTIRHEEGDVFLRVEPLLQLLGIHFIRKKG